MDEPFRKLRRQTDPWHFCQRCSRWPVSGYVGRTDPPGAGANLCRECVAKHAMGTCELDCRVLTLAREHGA